MALQITTNINVDFYDNKYIMVEAKQYDDRSRLISITCYNQGDLYNLSAKNHTAYVKYKKADGRWVLNSCVINYKGQVLVELTEQMLVASGICYVDLFIVNKGSAKVNMDTGSIVTVDGSSVLTTKAFYVDVQEAVVDNSLIESIDEYDGLTDLLSRAEAEYSDVIQLSKSYAIGTGNVARENDEKDNSEYYSKVSKSWAVGSTGVRTGENTDNAKYYSKLAGTSASNASTSEANANAYMNTTNEYMNTTNEYMDATESYMDDTEGYMNSANEYMNAAESYKNATKTYMDNTAISERNAKTSETNALTSEQNAKASETASATSEANAKTSEDNSADSAILSQSYAVGGTGTRTGEDTNNAYYYYEMTKTVANGLNSGFIPMGTITFDELATAEKATGYTYNISDDFVTTEDFAEGSGKSYTAGVNVYYRADGLWDAFGGMSSPTATVDEVKEYLGI